MIATPKQIVTASTLQSACCVAASIVEEKLTQEPSSSRTETSIMCR